MSLVLTDHTDPKVSILSLNRPEKRNALNSELMETLVKAIQETQKIPGKRVIILKGEGPVFCSGLDLTEASDHTKSETLARLFHTLYTSSLVTIATVHGAAIAGGGGLMVACDYVLADPKTLFGFPEVRRGLVAAQVLVFLRRQLRERDIRELLLFGELINAEKAKGIGLINLIVDQKNLLEEALRLVDYIVLGAPQAIADTKQLLQGQFSEELSQALEVHRQSRSSPEAQEGIAAYLEHRPPLWG